MTKKKREKYHIPVYENNLKLMAKTVIAYHRELKLHDQSKILDIFVTIKTFMHGDCLSRLTVSANNIFTDLAKTNTEDKIVNRLYKSMQEHKIITDSNSRK
jgi:hypothetical protein